MWLGERGRNKGCSARAIVRSLATSNYLSRQDETQAFSEVDLMLQVVNPL